MMQKLICAALLNICGTAYATSIGGVTFVDRNATGEIVLGGLRGSLAVLDYDNDGWPDLVIRHFAGSATRLFHNVPDVNRPGYRTFVNVGAGSGLDDADSNPRGAFGMVAADIDNDGDTDVYMTGYLTSDNTAGLLYRNDGGGHFTNITVAAVLRTTGTNTQSASFNDYDHDGYVDLMTFNSASSPNFVRLYHNNHNNTFTDVTSITPAIPASGNIYSHLWMDYDGDGWDDAFLLTVSGSATLLKNIDNGAGGRVFVNVASSVGFVHLGPAPMGIAAGDMDGDGDLDLCITDAVRGTYYRNDGVTMTEITPFATFFGWGTTWLDVDNDGDLDNYQAGSFGTANVDHLTRNLGSGQWDDISAALNTTALPSQHMVQVDFNNDGRQDLITINPGIPSVSVYENLSNTGNHWLKLQLVGNGVSTNRSAIGAVVRLTAGGQTQVREIISGSSTSATEDLRPHFGIGASTSVDSIQVIWPRQGTIAARTETFTGPFAADQILMVTEGSTPVVTGWHSVRTHNGTDLAIDLSSAATGNGSSGPTVESRQGGIQRILVDFNQPVLLVNAGAVSITGRSTLAGVLQPPVNYSPVAAVTLLDPDTMQIALSPGSLPDQTCCTINVLGSVQNASGLGLSGDADCLVRFLVGDTSGNGLVNLCDSLAARARTGSTAVLSPSFDVNLSGGNIDWDDALMIKSLVTGPPHQALCP